MPKGLTAAGGIDCLVHAIESYVSIFATDYTKASGAACLILYSWLARFVLACNPSQPQPLVSWSQAGARLDRPLLNAMLGPSSAPSSAARLQALSREAVRVLVKYLPRAYRSGWGRFTWQAACRSRALQALSAPPMPPAATAAAAAACTAAALARSSRAPPLPAAQQRPQRL